MDTLFDEREVLEEAADRWWLFLITGIAWLVFALIVFQWDYATVSAISYLFGVIAIVIGVNEFMAIPVSTTGWKWVHALLGVLFIVGGIYGGFITATEAAAVTAFYVLVMEVFLYRDLKLVRDIPRIMRESMMLVGAILAIFGTALGLTNYFIDQQIPQKLFELVQAHVDSKVTFLIILNGLSNIV